MAPHHQQCIFQQIKHTSSTLLGQDTTKPSDKDTSETSEETNTTKHCDENNNSESATTDLAGTENRITGLLTGVEDRISGLSLTENRISGLSLAEYRISEPKSFLYEQQQFVRSFGNNLVTNI